MLTRFFVDGRQLELYPNAKFGIQSRGRSQAQQQGLVPGAGVGGSGGIKSCRCCCLLDCLVLGLVPFSSPPQPPTTASYKRDKSPAGHGQAGHGQAGHGQAGHGQAWHGSRCD